jgi:ADP-ribosyl-[dinitrogen reductase] hydrolase
MKHLLPLVLAAVKAAGDMLVAEAARPGGPRGGGDKAAIDLEIEAMLEAALRPLVPAGFTGEETGRRERPAGSDLVWLVDPQDGTSDFLRGSRGSSVSVALLRGGDPVLGVVYAPLSPDRGPDMIAWAEGTPLTRNGRTVEPHLAGRGLGPEEAVCLNPRAARQPEPHAALCAPAGFVCMPSIAYRLARVAAGDSLVTVSQHRLHAWDFAGGHALVRAAGGILVDREGREPCYDPVTGLYMLDHCFAGAEAAARALAARPWDTLKDAQSAPARLELRWPRAGETAMLERACGALIGALFADHRLAWARFAGAGLAPGQPGGGGERLLALARALHRGGAPAAEALQAIDRRWMDSAPFDPAAAGRAADQLLLAVPIGVCCAGRPEAAAARVRTGAAGPVSDATALAAALIARCLDRAPAGAARDLAQSLQALPCDDPRAQEAVQRGLAGEAGTGGTSAHESLQQACAALAAHLEATESGAGNGHGPKADAASALGAALIGAASGWEALPQGWSAALQACRPLARPGAGAGSGLPRPQEYWPDDVLLLADALLSLALAAGQAVS